jgi:hypothetical protein
VVNEEVVLSKFDGDEQVPEAEVERISIINGVVVSHDVINNGEVVGPVEDSDILGKDIGRLVSD